ncbi:MAG: lysylphosphatidylglycerol synthase transmembrane domain-containing protein [Gemmatimonadota bacterium]|nr:MAG: lysylphosphatidylglycerol synthase transmembrane domain-containing protein [Gemmatimonadota bacterium]
MKGAGIRLLQLVLTVVVTWVIIDRLGVSFGELRELNLEQWRPNLLVLTGSGLVLLFGYFMSAALWGRMVVDLGGPAIPMWRAVKLFMIANMGRYVPGKVWQIAGLALLAKKEGVSARIATGSAVLGQGFALLGATVIGLGLFLGPNQEWRTFGEVATIVVVALLLAILTPAVFGRLLTLWFRLTGEEAPVRLRGRSTFGVRWLALFTLNWGVYATAFWLLYVSFGDFAPFIQLGPAFAAGYVAGYVAIFAPAGVGVREAAIIGFLTPVMSIEAATVLAVIARIWTTAVEVVPAGIFAVLHAAERPAAPTGSD